MDHPPLGLAYARARFLDLISAHSEAVWAAGWMTGIELDIRTDEQNPLWLAIAGVCQGWPQGYRAQDGWDPLTPEEQQRLRAVLEPTWSDA